MSGSRGLPFSPVSGESRCSWCRRRVGRSRTGWTGSDSSRCRGALAACSRTGERESCSGSCWRGTDVECSCRQGSTSTTSSQRRADHKRTGLLFRHVSFVAACARLSWPNYELLQQASECPDIKNYKWRLNTIWHRMLYSCTHATSGVKKAFSIVSYRNL